MSEINIELELELELNLMSEVKLLFLCITRS